jgi:hypothetical protein
MTESVRRVASKAVHAVRRGSHDRPVMSGVDVTVIPGLQFKRLMASNDAEAAPELRRLAAQRRGAQLAR